MPSTVSSSPPSTRNKGDEGGGDIPYINEFMQLALQEASRALLIGEVPVGCILVSRDRHTQYYESHTSQRNSEGDGDDAARYVAAYGSNETNQAKYALAHAEFVALEKIKKRSTDNSELEREDYVLYVTVEPCIMCASMLLYNSNRIAKVFYGCGNDRFGGNGSILSIHSHNNTNSDGENSKSGEDSLSQYCIYNHYNNKDNSSKSKGKGAFGYASSGGHMKEEAIELLQRFYFKENVNAPPEVRKVKKFEKE